MQKRYLPIILGIFLTSFVSAYNYGLSLSDFLNNIDSSTMILGAVFIVAFAIINFSLTKAFKDNKATAGVIAFVISLFITWGINKSGFDFEGLFYGIGINAGFLEVLLPIILIAGIVGLIFWVGGALTLIILGIALLIASSTDYIYETGTGMFLGAILFIAGLGWALLRRRQASNDERQSRDRRRSPRNRRLFSTR